MPTTPNRHSRRQIPNHREVAALESPKKMTEDFVEYLTDYSRENPGYAALACIGVGFVLGWKLKPW